MDDSLSCAQPSQTKLSSGNEARGKFIGYSRDRAMKSREPRIKVLIGARMRAGAAWGDVCLLNLSSRGVLAQAAVPPLKGAYIEVRRGSHVIVARVVWAKKHRFGALTQDPIGVDAIIADASGSKSNAACAEVDRQSDRRAAGPPQVAGVQHENSRLIGRAMEFCSWWDRSRCLRAWRSAWFRKASPHPWRKSARRWHRNSGRKRIRRAAGWGGIVRRAKRPRSMPISASGPVPSHSRAAHRN